MPIEKTRIYRNDSKLTHIIIMLILMQPLYDVFIYYLNAVLSFDSIIISLVRPLIAAVLYLFLLVRGKLSKKLKIGSFLLLLAYGAYCVLHIFNIRTYFYSGSYGTLLDELRHMSVYGYFLLLLVSMYFAFLISSHNDRKNIIKAVAYAACIISVLHLLSVITGTSALTYAGKADKFGYKGWSVSAHYVGHSILLSLPVVIDVFFERKLVGGWYKYLLFLLLVLSVFFVIGTKAPAYGLLAVLLIYAVIKALYLLIKRERIQFDHIYLLAVVVVLIVTLPYTSARSNLHNQNMIGQSDTEFDSVDFVMEGMDEAEEEPDPDKPQRPANAFKRRMKRTLDYASQCTAKVMDNRQIQLVMNSHLQSISPLRDKFLGYGFHTMPKNTWVETDTLALYYSYGYLGVLMVIGLPLVFVMYWGVRALLRIRKLKASTWVYGMGICLGFCLVTVVGYTMFFAQTVFYFAAMLVAAVTNFQEVVDW